MVGPTRRLFFGGDTGYFAGFREVGERLGPFDLVAMAIGAYEPPEIMRAPHTTPEEALQAFADLRGQRFMAIHWGTFDLADEPPGEPPGRLRSAAAQRGMSADQVWVFAMGETRAW